VDINLLSSNESYHHPIFLDIESPLIILLVSISLSRLDGIGRNLPDSTLSYQYFLALYCCWNYVFS